MTIRVLLALAVLLVPINAVAQDGIEGVWNMRIAGTTIFRFEIEEEEDEWRGTWHKPASFRTNGDAFSRLSGGVESQESMTGIEFLGNIELSFDDPRPGAVPDIFRFELVDEDNATMTYVGTDLAPYSLMRAEEGSEIGDWNPDRVYVRRGPGEESAEFAINPGPADSAADDAEEEDDRPRIGADFLEGF